MTCRFVTDRPNRTGEGGFALVAALLVLVGLTALATAGFLRSGTDHRVTQNHRATVNAFYVAEAGLWTFISRHRGPPTDTVVYSFSQGTATVHATPINAPNETGRVYLVTSRGAHQPPEGGQAVRTVSAATVSNLLTLHVPGALTSGIGIQKNGDAGALNGFDDATSADCPLGGLEDRAGVVVPPDGYQQSGGDPVPEGDPDIYDEEDGITLLENTGIDWDGIVNGGILEPDYTVPPDGWPDFGALPDDEWPVIYVDEALLEVSPDHSGRGTLIARHDLRMNGNFQWDGLILTGGAILSDGNQTVKGGAVSGLNLLLGESPTSTSLGNGNKTFRYNSCHAFEAMSRLATLAAQPGSWFESM